MATDDKIRDGKLKYNINREAANISAVSSSRIDKDEYLTDKEILTFNQSQMMEKAKFTHSLLGKAFEKQNKTKQKNVWRSRRKTNKALRIFKLFLKDKWIKACWRYIFRNAVD